MGCIRTPKGGLTIRFAWGRGRPPGADGIAANLLRQRHQAEAKVLKAAAKSAMSEGMADARALKSMAAIDRETLLLYAWLTCYEGIALAMSVPVGTVRSCLNRARKTLRTQLNLEKLTETEKDHGRLAAAPRNA